MVREEVDEQQLERAKKRMLEMLIVLDKFCKKNKIKYWLSSGTFLGAVRHGGFIPWDDDIDIEMLSSDYKIFLKLSQDELKKDNIFIQTSKTDCNYKKNLLKLRDMNSTYIERDESREERYHQGIMLDIFEVKIYPKKIFWGYKLLKIASFNGEVSRSERNIKKIILKTIKFIHIHYLGKKILNFFEFQETILGATTFLGMNETSAYKMETEFVFPLSKIEFEGHIFSCPGNAHGYLRSLYGEGYMELPPEEKRRAHARYIDVDQLCYCQKKSRRIKL